MYYARLVQYFYTVRKQTDDAIAKLYVTKFSTISLYLTKFYVLYSFAIATSVTYREICKKNFSLIVWVCYLYLKPFLRTHWSQLFLTNNLKYPNNTVNWGCHEILKLKRKQKLALDWRFKFLIFKTIFVNL